MAMRTVVFLVLGLSSMTASAAGWDAMLGVADECLNTFYQWFGELSFWGKVSAIVFLSLGSWMSVWYFLQVDRLFGLWGGRILFLANWIVTAAALASIYFLFNGFSV